MCVYECMCAGERLLYVFSVKICMCNGVHIIIHSCKDICAGAFVPAHVYKCVLALEYEPICAGNVVQKHKHTETNKTVHTALNSILL